MMYVSHMPANLRYVCPVVRGDDIILANLPRAAASDDYMHANPVHALNAEKLYLIGS